ncbi:hypothetical protein BKA70DRAFT_1220948 [Coprinopsis sp. MPI-PUGE-AT-0042]|nr:hypothetical protein BKA70DRAFT_1220948 [Coprinopsis sp. MPI-PUGE-AT-0042]
MPPVELFYPKQQVAISTPNHEPPPLADDDEARYTLSGYGSIPVSNSLFVPSAPTPISPRKKRKVDDDGFITPPQRYSRSQAAAPGSVTPSKSPTPSVEFAALPNHKTIVARLKELRDHIRYKEEHNSDPENRDENKDPDVEASFVTKGPLQDKNPAPWYLDDPDSRRKETTEESHASRPARVQRPGPPAPVRHERDHEELLRESLVPFMSRFRM